MVHDFSESEDDLKKGPSPIKNQQKETLRCISCNLEFSEKITFTEHYSSVHEKKNPFKCLICKKAFATKDNVKFHILAVHSKNRNHVEDFIYEDTTSSKTVDNKESNSSQ